MIKLYRNTRDLQHWFVHLPGIGWARFPAKVDGWSDRRMVATPSQRHLNRVPNWLAFNTGLLESLEARAPTRNRAA